MSKILDIRILILI